MATEKRLIPYSDAVRFLRDSKVPETGAFSKGINKGLNIALSALGNEEIFPHVAAVEVVHGHWSQKDIISKKAGYGVRYYYHAECEVAPCRLFECAHDYCPNCGAKMDGDGNG